MSLVVVVVFQSVHTYFAFRPLDQSSKRIYKIFKSYDRRQAKIDRLEQIKTRLFDDSSLVPLSALHVMIEQQAPNATSFFVCVQQQFPMTFCFGMLVGTAGGSIYLSTLDPTVIKRRLNIAFALTLSILVSMMGAWQLYQRIMSRKNLMCKVLNPFCFILMMASAVLSAFGSSQETSLHMVWLFLGNIGLAFGSMLGFLNTERHLKEVLGTECFNP